MQLQRIARFLGIPDPAPQQPSSSPAEPRNILQEFAAAGIPVSDGRPDDPMLDFLDL